MLPNKDEEILINRFFKYNHLLDNDTIPYNKKGSQIAIEILQGNSNLSNFLGYPICDNINFTYIHESYFGTEIVKIENKKCLLCHGELKDNRGNISLVCLSCGAKSIKMDMGFCGSYNFRPFKSIACPIEVINQKTSFEHEYFDLDIKFCFHVTKYTCCLAEYIKRNLKYILCTKIKIKKNIFKPNILINKFSVRFDSDTDIEYLSEIKESHKSILGWKRVTLI